MDRQRTLLALAQKMRAAVAAEDWKVLSSLNTLLAKTLPSLAAQGQWNAGEQAALLALRQAHGEAVRHCERATADLAARLNDMQANKEGWLAYALDSEDAETGIHV